MTEQTGRTVNYAYDEIYRLTSETVTGAPVSAQNGAVGYTLDAVGNRLTRASTLAALTPQSLAYNANDRLTTDTYDNNGNTIGADGKTFAYDFENRIKSVGGGAITIVYDGDGNRMAGISEQIKVAARENLVAPASASSATTLAENFIQRAALQAGVHGLRPSLQLTIHCVYTVQPETAVPSE